MPFLCRYLLGLFQVGDPRFLRSPKGSLDIPSPSLAGSFFLALSSLADPPYLRFGLMNSNNDSVSEPLRGCLAAAVDFSGDKATLLRVNGLSLSEDGPPLFYYIYILIYICIYILRLNISFVFALGTYELLTRLAVSLRAWLFLFAPLILSLGMNVVMYASSEEFKRKYSMQVIEGVECLFSALDDQNATLLGVDGAKNLPTLQLSRTATMSLRDDLSCGDDTPESDEDKAEFMLSNGRPLGQHTVNGVVRSRFVLQSTPLIGTNTPFRVLILDFVSSELD